MNTNTIKASFYDYIKNLVRCIPNDTVLGRTVREYVTGSGRYHKPKRQKQIVYRIRF